MAAEGRSLLIPLVVAAMGVIPLALMASGAEPSSPTPAVEVEATAPTTIVAVDTTLASPPSTTVVVTPVPEIAGVSDDIALVLAAHGFAGEEAVSGLSDSVVAVLKDRGVVLTIEIPEGGE